MGVSDAEIKSITGLWCFNPNRNNDKGYIIVVWKKSGESEEHGWNVTGFYGPRTKLLGGSANHTAIVENVSEMHALAARDRTKAEKLKKGYTDGQGTVNGVYEVTPSQYEVEKLVRERIFPDYIGGISRKTDDDSVVGSYEVECVDDFLLPQEAGFIVGMRYVAKKIGLDANGAVSGYSVVNDSGEIFESVPANFRVTGFHV